VTAEELLELLGTNMEEMAEAQEYEESFHLT
jgi:hypothetical protein